MSPKGKCHQKLNVTKTEITPKQKCQQDWNVTKTETSPKLKFHQNWYVTKTEMCGSTTHCTIKTTQNSANTVKWVRRSKDPSDSHWTKQGRQPAWQQLTKWFEVWGQHYQKSCQKEYLDKRWPEGNLYSLRQSLRQRRRLTKRLSNKGIRSQPVASGRDAATRHRCWQTRRTRSVQ